MKLQDALNEIKEGKPIGANKLILIYILAHETEVYRFTSFELQKAFPYLKPNTISMTLSSLARENKISKVRLGRYVYYGTKKAVVCLYTLSTQSKIKSNKEKKKNWVPLKN